MQIIQGIEAFKQYHQGKICLALGNFDGVHLGHRKIIAATIAMAKKKKTKSAVLIFLPHPLSVLFPERSPELLLTVNDRIRMLGDAGIDYVIIHPFSREFASVLPEIFVRDILYNALSAAGVVVGFDYSFGRHGQGTPADLEKLGARFGFSVQVVEPVTVEDEVVGSTSVRYLLSEGKIKAANRLLGYPFYLRGKVIHGDGRGRRLGFPTANIQVTPDIILPAYGVYITKVVTRGMTVWALTNIGRRPTFRKKDPSIEVHLLDVNKNLYEEELIVCFLQRMREEKTFENVEALIVQISSDIEEARALIQKKMLKSADFPPFLANQFSL